MKTARQLWIENNYDRVLEYKRRSAKKAYKSNPDKFKDYQSKWRKENKEKVRKRDAKYRVKYANERRKQFADWRKRNKDYFRNRHTSDVQNLANWYVRQKLSQKTQIQPDQWPADLVDLKRAKIKLTRLCRKLQTTHN